MTANTITLKQTHAKVCICIECITYSAVQKKCSIAWLKYQKFGLNKSQ